MSVATFAFGDCGSDAVAVGGVGRYRAQPDAHTRHRHFLGPIVLDQQHFDPGGVDPRLVIDGQQRPTTLQVILAAAANVASAHGAEDVANELNELTLNRGRAAVGNLRFKVWLSRRDRTAFLETIENGADGQTEGIGGAWHYFRDRIDEWVTDDGDADAAQIKRAGGGFAGPARVNH